MLLFRYSSWIFILSYLFLMRSQTQIFEFEIFRLSGIPFTFSFIFDKIRVSFRIVVTLISGRVFFFARKYMEEDPFATRFIWILLSFVISMNLLIFSGSIFFLLLGWDGLGITSFALIIYYESGESQIAGFQTLMINRIGDVIIVLSFFLMCCGGQFTIFRLRDKFFYRSGCVMLLCLAALTKRAQFPFRSWLPAAIAAPTPVRALVHSSTLVTAGIFIIIRLRHRTTLRAPICRLLLLCGSVTCLLGGWAATFENDIKKVIALSTLRQLGVIVFSLGMNLPALGLFHLFTHALFKALLFLAAGHILIMTFGSQDVRQIGGLGLRMPFTSLMFTVRSLCLVGAPFMSAFYSKHLILELIMSGPINMVRVTIILVATFITAKYVFRTLKGVVWGKSRTPLLSGCRDIYTFLPVLVLGTGAVCGGEFISRLDISTLEYVFIPSRSSTIVNLVTITGIRVGLAGLRKRIRRNTLSTLFFLTPLVYGRPKAFSKLISSVGVLDYGWLEPYYLIKKKFYSRGSFLSQESLWPDSRLLVALRACLSIIIYASIFSY